MKGPAFLDRHHTIAPEGYSQWLVPPAALAIHLCIGQAYALSVFNLPMSRLLGVSQTAAGDWPLTTTVWIFNIAIVFLGLSAAVFGTWVERVGPRKAIFASACCFSAGFLISAIGVVCIRLASFISATECLVASASASATSRRYRR